MSSAKTAPGDVDRRKGVSARRIRAVHRRLRKLQGPFKPKPRVPIIDELVGTLLSQHTSDTNTARAFAGLKTRFPTWEEVRDAPSEEVADAIRAGGLADQKAPRIKAILTEIEGREGALDLSRLHGLPDQEVDDYLCSLPGVGPKTAACVLVFSMGRNAFPIDTHVHRVARRLGWIDDGVTAEAAGRELSPKVPAEIRYSLHMALIDHGRKVCKARNPRCSQCVLFDLCGSGPRLIATGDAI
ncbi:MAG: endonuclease III [Actinobacteria bacterium]|nr:endonuclease III [Actinomycetota bacterium]